VTLQRQFGFWVGALFALIAVLWLFSEILLPFLAGMVLAYFLDPVADALERVGLSRLASTLIILVCVILLFVAVLLLVLPILGDQIANFASNLPSYIKSLIKLFDDLAPQWAKDMIAKSGADVQGSVTDIAGRAAGWIAALLASIWSGGLALVNILSLLVVTPIVAFYMLNDWDKMVAKVDHWLPREHVETIRALFRQINDAMAGFIRGQGTVCASLAIFYAIALTLVGLNFGLLIGLAAGMLSFIPFVGALIGGIAAIGTGLVQFWPDWTSVLIVFGVFAAGQFIEGNFLSPKLVGNRIGLHPVWLMFALVAFGYLFGFVGLLLAVPLAAAVGVVIRFGLAKYLKSPIYLGSQREVPVPMAFEAPAPKRARKSK
jgi:predicted PurR-regulated permease PerM